MIFTCMTCMPQSMSESCLGCKKGIYLGAVTPFLPKNSLQNQAKNALKLIRLFISYLCFQI